MNQFAPQIFKGGRVFDAIANGSEDPSNENSYNGVEFDSKFGKG